MKLIPVYHSSVLDDAPRILWDLMEEAEPHQVISHNAMPTWEEHLRFVFWTAPQIYEAWYFIETESGETVGYIYLSRRNEIGIRLYKHSQRKGYGREAVDLLRSTHGPRRYLWNVNPQNTASIALARKLGFVGPIQHTYVLGAA